MSTPASLATTQAAHDAPPMLPLVQPQVFAATPPVAPAGPGELQGAAGDAATRARALSGVLRAGGAVVARFDGEGSPAVVAAPAAGRAGARNGPTPFDADATAAALADAERRGAAALSVYGPEALAEAAAEAAVGAPGLGRPPRVRPAREPGAAPARGAGWAAPAGGSERVA